MQAIRIQIHLRHHRNQEIHRCNRFIQMNHRTAKKRQPHDELGPRLKIVRSVFHNNIKLRNFIESK